MATITFNRTVDTNPNNTDTFVYVYTPNEPGLTTKTFSILRDTPYNVDAREAVFLREWLEELGYDASKYSVDSNGVVFNEEERNLNGNLIPSLLRTVETPGEL